MRCCDGYIQGIWYKKSMISSAGPAPCQSQRSSASQGFHSIGQGHQNSKVFLGFLEKLCFCGMFFGQQQVDEPTYVCPEQNRILTVPSLPSTQAAMSSPYQHRFRNPSICRVLVGTLSFFKLKKAHVFTHHRTTQPKLDRLHHKPKIPQLWESKQSAFPFPAQDDISMTAAALVGLLTNAVVSRLSASLRCQGYCRIPFLFGVVKVANAEDKDEILLRFFQLVDCPAAKTLQRKPHTKSRPLCQA